MVLLCHHHIIFLCKHFLAPFAIVGSHDKDQLGVRIGVQELSLQISFGFHEVLFEWISLNYPLFKFNRVTLNIKKHWFRNFKAGFFLKPKVPSIRAVFKSHIRILWISLKCKLGTTLWHLWNLDFIIFYLV